MGLINVPAVENGDANDENLFNSRFSTIVDEINGNLDADNLATDAITTPKLTDASVTPNKLVASTGTSWVWQSWTPTLTNLSGGTITYAKYIQIGKTVHFRFKYTLAGAGVSGNPRFTLPVTASADYVGNDTMESNGNLNDITALVWQSCLLVASTSAVDILYLNGSSNLAAISATAPFTWASGDRIDICGTYEAA